MSHQNQLQHIAQGFFFSHSHDLSNGRVLRVARSMRNSVLGTHGPRRLVSPTKVLSYVTSALEDPEPRGAS